MRGPWTLAADGCDRATAYHMSNKIIRRGDELVATWLDSRYRNVVATVDQANGQVVSKCLVSQGFDNHCGAAMTLTPDDVLHVMSGSHHRGFVYRASAEPARAESWSPPEAVGCRPTYPCLVSDLRGDLHCMYRWSSMSGDRWGSGWSKKIGDAPWQSASGFAEAPAPGYIYPTNAMALAPDGTLHLVIEWYKTYPDNVVPPHSMAISHYESADGAQWSHSDGREVASMPVRIEDADPIVFRGDANMRPGNLAVLPDGRPCFGIWERVHRELLLAVREPDRTWRVVDLAPALDARCPETYANGHPQVAATSAGELIMVLPRGETDEWAHPSSQLHVIRIQPNTAEVVSHEPIEKLDPEEPDWLPSIEKQMLGRYQDDPYVSYITGNRGTGCINEAQCRVRMVQVD